MSVNSILDYLVNDNTYMASIGDIEIRYEGMTEDTS